MLLATLGLFVGPLLYSVPHWRSWDRILDSFTVSAVGALCLFHLLPEAIEEGGWLAVIALLIGTLLPRFLRALEGVGPWVLLIGLGVHVAIESAAMGTLDRGAALSMAVILHRIPVGLAVFSQYHEHSHESPTTRSGGWVAIGALAIATVAGFQLGPTLLSTISPSFLAALEGGVAGMLLHIVWEREPHTHSVPEQQSRLAIAAASVLGLGIAAWVVSRGHAHEHGLSDIAIAITARVAPVLVLAYGLSALVAKLRNASPFEWIDRTLPSVALGALTLSYISLLLDFHTFQHVQFSSIRSLSSVGLLVIGVGSLTRLGPRGMVEQALWPFATTSEGESK